MTVHEKLDEILNKSRGTKIVATVPKPLWISGVEDGVYRTPTWVIDENYCSITNDGIITYNGDYAELRVYMQLASVGASGRVLINGETLASGANTTIDKTFYINKGDTIQVQAKSTYTSHTCRVVASIFNN